MLESLREERLKKLTLLKSKGIDPYPARSVRTLAIHEVRKHFKEFAKLKKKVVVAGRIIGLRDQGSVVFIDLRDESGEVQGVLKRDNLKEAFELWKSALDRGDFMSVSGVPFMTKRGEQSIEVKSLTILTKSLLPIPTEFYGLKDKETLLRKRYLDFVAHPELRELFKKKSVFWKSTRAYLEEHGFLEVETPILENVPGGAEAEPFVTHYSALDRAVYLRISPELPLKRLMVAGFEKVFEIGRIFRNEGIDAEHLQDYTQMEMYWAYQDYERLMKFVEAMIKKVIKETFGTLTLTHQERNIHWGKKWQRYDYGKLFYEATKIDPAKAEKGKLLKIAREKGIEQATEMFRKGRLIDLIYKKTVRPKLIEPGFLVNPPVMVEPLAKRMPSDPERVERFQLVACGTELGKGFSELNDPLDQRVRFEEQMKLRAEGDKEAQLLDEYFIEALEYGMPPTAGFGMSERFFAVLVDRPVREVVLFPLTRSRE